MFRGEAAAVLVEPTNDAAAVLAALEYLPTGGRTPLADALEVAQRLITDETLLVLVTDGRANVPTHTDDAWSDALQAAARIRCQTLVVDTESPEHALGKAGQLAEVMRAKLINLAALEAGYDFPVLLKSGVR